MKKITNENLNDFLKQVLQKIKNKKSKGQITTHVSPYNSPSGLQLPKSLGDKRVSTTNKRRSSSRSQRDTTKDKQLSFGFAMDRVPKPYTNGKKWLDDVYDKGWMYVGFDLTGYPTGLLPVGAFTKGFVLDNEIYQSAVIANPDFFMGDWNKSLKLKLADMKKKRNAPSTPPSPENPSDEDININELASIINEIIDEELSEVNHTQDDSGNSIIAQGAPGSVIRFATEHPQLIKQMRDWVKDCQWADLSEEDVDELSEEELLRGIQKNYEGGIKAFINDSQSNAEVPVGYKESLKENFQDEMPDGYTNDFQRAFAHSQATTPRKNELQKAKDLAKSGKYVMISQYPVHCKTTDACLGSETVIHKVYDKPEDATAELDKLNTGAGDEQYSLITPDSVKEPKKIDTKTDDSDVPFEGVGYVYDKDMKKDPKHIPGERWRVKFQESVSVKDVRDAIKEVINEMWDLNEVIQEGKPLPKDATQISGLIQRLKEGEYIWFSYDSKGTSGHGYGVDCKVEGDELTYRTIGKYGEYLETEEDIERYAKEVADDKFANYYIINAIQDYKKYRPRYSQEDDQQPGHYELYGPDRITWQDVTEHKGSLNEIISGYDDMIELIKQMTPEEQQELNSFVKSRGGSAYDAVLAYFEEKAGKSGQV